MVLYFIKSTFLLFVFSLIYKVSLERKKNLHFNRYFLVTSLVIALLFPLINFQFQIETPVIVNTKQLVLEQIPVIEFETIEKQTDVNFNYLKLAYLVVTTLFILKFLAHLFHLIRLKRGSTILKTEFGTIALNHKVKSPFSFLNTIFVNNTSWQNNEIETAILHHEQGHVLQKHTVDVLLIELLKTFMWFQPFLYLYKRFAQENHEYLADAFSLTKNTNITQYQNLILNYYTTSENVVALSSSIHFNNLKKRFIMMKNTKKGKVWNAVFYTATALITYFGFIGIEAKATDIKKVEDKISNIIEQSDKIIFNEPINKASNYDKTTNDSITLTYIKEEKSSGYFNDKENVYFYVVDENLKVVIYNRYELFKMKKILRINLKPYQKPKKKNNL